MKQSYSCRTLTYFCVVSATFNCCDWRKVWPKRARCSRFRTRALVKVLLPLPSTQTKDAPNAPILQKFWCAGDEKPKPKFWLDPAGHILWRSLCGTVLAALASDVDNIYEIFHFVRRSSTQLQSVFFNPAYLMEFYLRGSLITKVHNLINKTHLIRKCWRGFKTV